MDESALPSRSCIAGGGSRKAGSASRRAGAAGMYSCTAGTSKNSSIVGVERLNRMQALVARPIKRRMQRVKHADVAIMNTRKVVPRLMRKTQKNPSQSWGTEEWRQRRVDWRD